MRKRRLIRNDFPIGSFLSIAIMLIIVVTIGVLAYGKLSNIAETISIAARPDSRLLLVKGITADLSIAENSVKTYSLTGDTNDLQPFYLTGRHINAKLDEFYNITETNSRYRELSFALDSLIHEKFALQGEQIAFRGGNRVTTALEKLSRTLRRAAKPKTKAQDKQVEKQTVQARKKPIQEAEKEDTTEKKGLVGRIFSRKDKDSKKDTKKESRKKRRNKKKKAADSKGIIADSSALAEQKAAIRDSLAALKKPVPAALKEVMAKEISSIKVKEEKLSQSTLVHSLALTRAEQKLSLQISLVEREIEQIERLSIADKTQAAEQAALQVNRLVVIFSISVAILLFLLALGIYYYFRTTKSYQKSIQQARTEAENLAKARERFLATMSHEIRTPMNAIVGFSDLILKTDLNAEQQDKLQLVKRSADHLLSVVDSVLTYSRLAASQLQFEARPFLLKDTISLPLDLVRRDSEAKGLQLKRAIPKDLPKVVIGDDLRLRQVLLNLLGNAVKFTQKGSIELLVNEVKRSPKEIRLRFSVIDTGVGISGDRKDRVFNEFEQSESSTTRKYGGTGLGLSISRQIITQQGGIIDLQSEEGKGTTVFFELSFVIGSQKLPKKPIPKPGNTSIYAGKRLLIADDEDYNRKLLNEILRKQNAITESVSDGIQVLNLLKAADFDLILMDIHMPELNGLEATRAIRTGKAGKSNCKIPILALTAVSTDAEMATCIAAGCNQVLQKPYSEADLLHAINGLLAGVSPKAAKKGKLATNAGLTSMPNGDS
ncbi:MAG TPA: response regulator, partial [Bacteroidetes bacterium]|nr:response regulator [Bacteroidota bacterium]